MKLLQRTTVALLAAGALSVAGASAAVAEGSFNSTISSWTTGTKSRTWTDKNLDNVSTSVFVKGCTFNDSRFAYFGARLKRTNGAAPDTDLGTKDNNCKGSGSTVSWADQPSNTYYFDVFSIQHQSGDCRTSSGAVCRFDATGVTVKY